MKASLRLKVFRMNVIPVCVAVVLFMVLGIYQVRRFAGPRKTIRNLCFPRQRFLTGNSGRYAMISRFWQVRYRKCWNILSCMPEKMYFLPPGKTQVK